MGSEGGMRCIHLRISAGQAAQPDCKTLLAANLQLRAQLRSVVAELGLHRMLQPDSELRTAV